MKKILCLIFLCSLIYTNAFCITVGYSRTFTPSGAPTLTSSTIPSAGTTVSLLFSEAITIGSGGNAGWTLNTPTTSMTYSSGDTTDTFIYTLGATIDSTDNPTISYTQPGDGLENGAGDDLASIAGASVTNNSSQGGGATPIYHNEMDSVADPHTPTIGASTDVNGTPAISGDGVNFDEDGESFDATTTTSADAGTILVTMRPNYTGWPIADTYPVNIHSTLYIKIENGRYRIRYNSKSLLYTTNTDLVSGQLVTFRYTWARSGGDVTQTFYINGSSVANQTVTEASPTNHTLLYIGNGTPTGGTEANAVVEDVKVYDEVVTP